MGPEIESTGGVEPRGTLAIRTLAMPADTNPAGDIFGGWLMSQMDIAGGVTASAIAHGRVVTVAVESMEFHKPVMVGDVLCCYCDVEKIGTSSISLHVEVWVLRKDDWHKRTMVTEGMFTYVAIDENRKPRRVPKD